jgi:hypothetical protein
VKRLGAKCENLLPTFLFIKRAINYGGSSSSAFLRVFLSKWRPLRGATTQSNVRTGLKTCPIKYEDRTDLKVCP